MTLEFNAEGIGVLKKEEQHRHAHHLCTSATFTLKLAIPLYLLFLHAPLQTIAQTSNATCKSTSSNNWLFNSAGESPCLTWAKIQSLCLSTTSYINVPPLLDSSWSYNSPSASSTICQCNSVSYSLMAGCTYCQWPNSTIPSEDEWSLSCPAYNDQGLGFAENVEPLPAWASHTWSGGTWQPSIVSTLTSSPSSTATTFTTTLSRSFPSISTSASAATQTSLSSTLTIGSGATTTTSASTSGTSAPSKSASAKWGPVVGGVAGGVIGLVILFLLVRWYRDRNRNRNRARQDSAEEGEGGSTNNPYGNAFGPVSPFSPPESGGSGGLGKGGYGPTAVGVENKTKKKKKIRIAYPYANSPSDPSSTLHDIDVDPREGKSFLDMIVSPPPSDTKATKDQSKTKNKFKKGEEALRGKRDRTSSFFNEEAFADPRTAPLPPETDTNLLPPKAVLTTTAPYVPVHREQKGISYTSSILDLGDMRTRPSKPFSSLSRASRVTQEEQKENQYERERGEYLRSGGTYAVRQPNSGLEVDLSSSGEESSPSSTISVPAQGNHNSRQLIPTPPTYTYSRDFSAPPSPSRRTVHTVRTLPSLYEPETGAGTWTQSMMLSPVSHYPRIYEDERDRRASEGTGMIGAALGSVVRARESYWGQAVRSPEQVPELPVKSHLR